MKTIRTFFIFFALFATYSIHAQVSISTDGSEPDPSAMLDIKSTTKGVLFPRMTTAQRNAISDPAESLMIFNIDTRCIESFDKFISSWTGMYCFGMQYDCGDQFLDGRDNTVYNTVQIGDQCWMAENLKYLPSVVGPGTGSVTDTYYYVYDYDGTDVNTAKSKENYATYGVLYNWPAAMNGACPAGWHLPNDAEWTQLTNYVSSQGEHLCNNDPSYIAKALATKTNWESSNNECDIGNSPETNNSTGFTALPGGISYYQNSFTNIGMTCGLWSATESDATNAWGYSMQHNSSSIVGYSIFKELGVSVRCVRD